MSEDLQFTSVTPRATAKILFVERALHPGKIMEVRMLKLSVEFFLSEREETIEQN